MAKVKVFVYGRRQQQRQQQGRQRRRQGYDKSSPDFRHGELKTTFDKQKMILDLSRQTVIQFRQKKIYVCLQFPD